VLIHCAASGVGHMAVQLAKLCEANVIGTASMNRDLLRSLGLYQIEDYATSPF
jgi:NADPH:quinone reductase-like Zn-dependent oxidoreductase